MTNKAKIVDVEIICIGTFWELSIYDIFSSTSQFGRNLVLEEAWMHGNGKIVVSHDMTPYYFGKSRGIFMFSGIY